MTRPLSMTSFGRGAYSGSARTWTVEVKSVNHRFCDIKVKMSRNYAALEEKIKKEVSAATTRGHIDVIVTVTGDLAENIKLVPNLPLAREYYQSLQDIQKELNLPDSPTLQMVAEYKDIITPVEIEEDMDVNWQELQQALATALQEALQMKIDEGQALKQDMVERLQQIQTTVTQISDQIPELVQLKKQNLEERLANLLDGVDLDPQRLAQEVSIISDKSDVTEELVRLQSHIQQFEAFLEADEPVGRRLDFLLQEFLREINTMASKINNTDVTHKTVELKNEVEKMREQVQNLE